MKLKKLVYLKAGVLLVSVALLIAFLLCFVIDIPTECVQVLLFLMPLTIGKQTSPQIIMIGTMLSQTLALVIEVVVAAARFGPVLHLIQVIQEVH